MADRQFGKKRPDAKPAVQEPEALSAMAGLLAINFEAAAVENRAVSLALVVNSRLEFRQVDRRTGFGPDANEGCAAAQIEHVPHWTAQDMGDAMARIGTCALGSICSNSANGSDCAAIPPSEAAATRERSMRMVRTNTLRPMRSPEQTKPSALEFGPRARPSKRPMLDMVRTFDAPVADPRETWIPGSRGSCGPVSSGP